MKGIKEILKKTKIDNNECRKNHYYDLFYRPETGLWQGYKKITETGKPD